MPGLLPPPFWPITFECVASLRCNFMTTELPMQLTTTEFPVRFTTSKVSGAASWPPSFRCNFITANFPVELHDQQVSGATSWPVFTSDADALNRWAQETIPCCWNVRVCRWNKGAKMHSKNQRHETETFGTPCPVSANWRYKLSTQTVVCILKPTKYISHLITRGQWSSCLDKDDLSCFVYSDFFTGQGVEPETRSIACA